MRRVTYVALVGLALVGCEPVVYEKGAVITFSSKEQTTCTKYVEVAEGWRKCYYGEAFKRIHKDDIKEVIYKSEPKGETQVEAPQAPAAPREPWPRPVAYVGYMVAAMGGFALSVAFLCGAAMLVAEVVKRWLPNRWHHWQYGRPSDGDV